MASVAKPTTCCGKGGESCICAQKATCSCGAKPALQCSCDKAATENVKPASGSSCACGLRSAGACTCEKSGSAGGNSSNEIDFTTKK
ncbi:hypothetical protein N0V93_002631 [Gnomoniopsis smithogilvyi]|uniref:DUF7871 domain-containing protein n=1 Tax=Gnomoniopsis smithogilvyi TaxID=1191159 RepID=A0A9W8YX39_9PEZI|nr:hypothetical protein N0V93_002631 [Gnomoniopsis smithogilvyi]